MEGEGLDAERLQVQGVELSVAGEHCCICELTATVVTQELHKTEPVTIPVQYGQGKGP